MAAKIVISQTLAWSNSGESLSGKIAATITPEGGNAIENIQTIGTSAEPIILGDVEPGWLLFKNLDTTNYVEIGTESDVSDAQLKLKPGEGVLMPTEIDAWFAKANTAECNLLVIGVDA